jgi:crotonobetainyl-CoA:carnitine CoA-transferase CaiB-like acyl-CoA transferase
MTTTDHVQNLHAGSLALSGIKVLDLGQAFMGPYCGLLLQRLGADVVKVEPPQGEPYRRPTARKGVEAVQFSLLNAGKRSLCIDLKQPEGRRLFIELAKSADVVLQNYAPETFERLVGTDELLRGNPRLIVASGSGYGGTGPYRALRAMDLTIQAVAGVMATTGFAEGPPTRTGPAVVDMMGGSHLTSAILAALVQRGVSGRGQHVEVALFDAILPSLASNIGAYFDSDGESPERTGNRHGGLAVAPYNAYETADGWIAILCLHDRHWSAACAVMGRPELAEDPLFSSNAARTTQLDELDAIVAEWTGSRPTVEAAEALTAAGVPCAPVKSLAEVISDPQLAARGMLEHHSNAERDWWTFGSPLRLSGSPAPDDNVPARLGQHSSEILAERLGLSAPEIDELVTAGVIVGEPAVDAAVALPDEGNSLAYADTADM